MVEQEWGAGTSWRDSKFTEPGCSEAKTLHRARPIISIRHLFKLTQVNSLAALCSAVFDFALKDSNIMYRSARDLNFLLSWLGRISYHLVTLDRENDINELFPFTELLPKEIEISSLS